MKPKIVLFSFLIGLILSAICGVIVGNKIFYIITVALISGLVMAVISLVVYKVLEVKVPEFVEFLEGFSYIAYEEEYSEEEEETSETIDDYKARQTASEYEYTPQVTETKKKEKPSSSSDVITIDNITIKNEPKLMAEAIRTMLASDEPSSSTPQK